MTGWIAAGSIFNGPEWQLLRVIVERTGKDGDSSSVSAESVIVEVLPRSRYSVAVLLNGLRVLNQAGMIGALMESGSNFYNIDGAVVSVEKSGQTVFDAEVSRRNGNLSTGSRTAILREALTDLREARPMVLERLLGRAVNEKEIKVLLYPLNENIVTTASAVDCRVTIPDSGKKERVLGDRAWLVVAAEEVDAAKQRHELALAHEAADPFRIAATRSALTDAEERYRGANASYRRAWEELESGS